jgi:phosphoglycerate dehydrogenase-like enzyme
MVVSSGFTQNQFDALAASEPDGEFVAATDATVFERAVDIDALIGCPRRAFTRELLARAGDRLRWVHGGGAGVEELLFPEFAASHITLTNGKVIQGPGVADHAMALLLALARNLHLIIRGETDKPLPRPLELRGKSALVVGLGGIGLLIAERAAAFGMSVSGTYEGNLPPMLSILDSVYTPEELDEALPLADAVIVSAPHTAKTQGMFGEHEFRLMKESVFFIVVSRGKLVQTEALVTALQEGQIQAAGLDVTDPEPLPADHPLQKMSNVIITPHIAGLSDLNRQRSMELISTNVHRFVRGLPVFNPVDKSAGF